MFVKIVIFAGDKAIWECHHWIRAIRNSSVSPTSHCYGFYTRIACLIRSYVHGSNIERDELLLIVVVAVICCIPHALISKAARARGSIRMPACAHSNIWMHTHEITYISNVILYFNLWSTTAAAININAHSPFLNKQFFFVHTGASCYVNIFFLFLTCVCCCHATCNIWVQSDFNLDQFALFNPLRVIFSLSFFVCCNFFLSSRQFIVSFSTQHAIRDVRIYVQREQNTESPPPYTVGSACFATIWEQWNHTAFGWLIRWGFTHKQNTKWVHKLESLQRRECDCISVLGQFCLAIAKIEEESCWSRGIENFQFLFFVVIFNATNYEIRIEWGIRKICARGGDRECFRLVVVTMYAANSLQIHKISIIISVWCGDETKTTAITE